MNADDIRRALGKRHPDLRGEWLTYSECWRMDFFAMRAWRGGIGQRRVGYEIKVSRADFRSEMRRPYKRANALALTHQFYFACPAGMLRPDEMPPEAGLVWVLDDGRFSLRRPAPLRPGPREFTYDEVIYLARFPLYREGIAEMAAELANLRALARYREQRARQLDLAAPRLFD